MPGDPARLAATERDLRRFCGSHLGVPGPGAENPTDMWARSAGIITQQARHRAGLAGLRWRVRYTVGRDTVNSSARTGPPDHQPVRAAGADGDAELLGPGQPGHVGMPFGPETPRRPGASTGPVISLCPGRPRRLAVDHPDRPLPHSDVHAGQAGDVWILCGPAPHGPAAVWLGDFWPGKVAVPGLNRTPARPVQETDRSLCWPPAGRSHRTQPAPGAGRAAWAAHPEGVACGEKDNEHRSGRAATARRRRGPPRRAGHPQKSSRIIQP